MGAVVIGVVGARGGAGATVMAAGLAHALAARDRQVTLVDLAPENGGIDVLLGIENEPGLRWPDLADARGRVDGPALRERLPRWDSVAVVGATRDGPARMPTDATSDVCLALADASDVVILDLSRGILARALPYSAPVLQLCDEALVVTPLDLVAVGGALVARDALARVHCRAALVIRGPAPGTLDAVEVSDVLGLEIACEVGWDARLAGAVERGFGPSMSRGPLHRAAGVLARRYPADGWR